MKYSIESIYRTLRSNGYGKECAYRRFCFLKGLSFGSVLDVGSGPCLLRQWLLENGIHAQYEAVDIRPDALALCGCKTYESVPTDRIYDLVCLFGTVTFNIGQDEAHNKTVLLDLLRKSKAVCGSLLLFTVFKESIRDRYKNSACPDYFVYFSREEIDEIMEKLRIFKYTIVENSQLDDQEYFVLAHLAA